MTTINETVDATLAANGYQSYGQYAAPVVTALVNREQQIVGTLIEFAQNSDLDVDGVRNALAEAGLHMPPAPVATGNPGTPAAEGDVLAILTRMEQTLTGLTQFARSNGYTG